MRPRISREEAKFLLSCLETRKEEIQGLVERKEQLERECYRIHQEILRGDTKPLLDNSPRCYKEKKQELQDLEAATMTIWYSLRAYESLIAKFTVIANGTKRLGRYKFEADRWKLHLPHLQKNGSINN